MCRQLVGIGLAVLGSLLHDALSAGNAERGHGRVAFLLGNAAMCAWCVACSALYITQRRLLLGAPPTAASAARDDDRHHHHHNDAASALSLSYCGGDDDDDDFSCADDSTYDGGESRARRRARRRGWPAVTLTCARESGCAP